MLRTPRMKHTTQHLATLLYQFYMLPMTSFPNGRSRLELSSLQPSLPTRGPSLLIGEPLSDLFASPLRHCPHHQLGHPSHFGGACIKVHHNQVLPVGPK